MSAVDKVLAALDAGLQSSDEHGYPERIDDPTRCARCLLHEPATDTDICSSCRAFLLGDSDEDPCVVIFRLTFRIAVSDDTSPPVHYPGFPVTHADGQLTTMAAGPQGWWRICSRYVGDGRRVLEYEGYGVSGSWVTDDRRPFTVREFTSGDMRGAQLVDADGYMAHFVAYARHDGYVRPAAVRVWSSNRVPEWHAVTCQRCGAMYACDPQRTAEAHGIIANDGHGAGGSCDPLTRTRAEVTEGHDAEATDAPPGWLAHPRQRRDWQAEALAWARQGRRWLGL